MKLNIHLEECSSGWKVLADIEDVKTPEDLKEAKVLVADAAEYASLLPGWDTGKKDANPEQGEDNKWRKAYFARQRWNKGGRP